MSRAYYITMGQLPDTQIQDIRSLHETIKDMDLDIWSWFIRHGILTLDPKEDLFETLGCPAVMTWERRSEDKDIVTVKEYIERLNEIIVKQDLAKWYQMKRDTNNSIFIVYK